MLDKNLKKIMLSNGNMSDSEISSPGSSTSTKSNLSFFDTLKTKASNISDSLNTSISNAGNAFPSNKTINNLVDKFHEPSESNQFLTINLILIFISIVLSLYSSFLWARLRRDQQDAMCIPDYDQDGTKRTTFIVVNVCNVLYSAILFILNCVYLAKCRKSLPKHVPIALFCLFGSLGSFITSLILAFNLIKGSRDLCKSNGPANLGFNSAISQVLIGVVVAVVIAFFFKSQVDKYV